MQSRTEDPLGGWPRRLLHVPSMTSYEWQDGHQYGTHVKPRYNAISYTWGRYQLKSPNDQQHVKAIEVNGVSWDLPRIDESHFTVKQFEKVISRSIEAFTDLGTNPAHARHSTEFVWLDIACINQTPNHPQMAVEIGRQAKIFRGAKRVVVWLTQTKQPSLEKAVKGIVNAADTIDGLYSGISYAPNEWSSLPRSRFSTSLRSSGRWFRSKLSRTLSKIKRIYPASSPQMRGVIFEGNEPWLTAAISNISSLIDDRWFSSLWTLQESFLSQWAYLISDDLEVLRSDSPQLRSIFGPCEALYNSCKDSTGRKHVLGMPASSTEIELIDLIDRSGLAALAVENPMALYTVASTRMTSRPVDRIYGIMQVFDFQLGISAPNVNMIPGLPELELQLGEQLLVKYPIMSQLHVHTKIPEYGQAWRVSNSSRVPELASKVAFYVTSSFLGDHTCLCQFACADHQGTRWATFAGKVCAFEHLEKSWRLINSHGRHGKRGQSRSTQQIILDSTDILPLGMFTEDPTEDLPRDGRQQKLAEEIEQISHRNGVSISVLLLGTFSDQIHTEEWWKAARDHTSEYIGARYNIGLIMAIRTEDKGHVWRRLGICIWDLTQLASSSGATAETEFLEGRTGQWQHMEGLFG